MEWNAIVKMINEEILWNLNIVKWRNRLSNNNYSITKERLKTNMDIYIYIHQIIQQIYQKYNQSTEYIHQNINSAYLKIVMGIFFFCI